MTSGSRDSERQGDGRCVCGHRETSHDAEGECWKPGCYCDGYRPPAAPPPVEGETYGPDGPEDHVCDCGHPWDDHDLTGPLAGCHVLMCRCSPPEPEEEEDGVSGSG